MGSFAAKGAIGIGPCAGKSRRSGWLTHHKTFQDRHHTERNGWERTSHYSRQSQTSGNQQASLPPSSRNSSGSFFLPTYCGKALKRHFFSSMGKKGAVCVLSISRGYCLLFAVPFHCSHYLLRRDGGGGGDKLANH